MCDTTVHDLPPTNKHIRSHVITALNRAFQTSPQAHATHVPDVDKSADWRSKVATLETPVWSAERSAHVDVETYLDRAISIVAMRKGQTRGRRETASRSLSTQSLAWPSVCLLPPPSQLKLASRQKTHLSPREGIPRAFLRLRSWQNVTMRRLQHCTPC